MPEQVFPSKQFITFTFCGWQCALAIESVQEVVLLPRLVKPPGLPTAVAGFLEIGASLVPVLHLDKLLQLPEQPLDLYTPILVVKSENQPFAFLAEKLDHVSTIAIKNLSPVAPSDSWNGCIESTYEEKGHKVHVFSHGQILLEKEKQSLEEFRAWELKRGASIGKSGPRSG